MAADYRIHRPFVLATLPRPLDHTNGQIFAREVYGQRDGQKRRKRPELVVGIDGEAASIYDIAASRLITSYPVPPQESFTCAPFSVRVRTAGSRGVSRYTFAATGDASRQKITLFKDVVHQDGKTTSSSTSQTLQTSVVLHLTCSQPTSSSPSGNVLAVCHDGEVACLDGETLSQKWTASTRSLVQDSVASVIEKFDIEYVTSGTVDDFREGIFQRRPEVFSTLPKGDESSPELFAVVSRSTSRGQHSAHVVVLAASTGSSSTLSDMQTLAPLDIVSLPPTAQSGSKSSPSYEVDIQAGLLLQLENGAVSIYDITGAVAKLKSIVRMEDAETFIRMSRPFILSASLDSIGLYNYQYRSIHARTALDLCELPAESRDPRSCRLISHWRSQDLVIALMDNMLVTIQVEPPRSNGKRRKGGMLIDSIGRGTAVEIPAKKLKFEKTSKEFSQLIPGTMTDKYLEEYQADIETADSLLSNDEVAQWEDMLRQKFQMSPGQTSTMTNGNGVKHNQETQEWKWMASPSLYPAVDRRWVLYALSQVFSLESGAEEASAQRLRLVLPDSNVTTYLVVAGHMTMSNLQSAFREDIDSETTESLARDLIQCLTEADPSMTLLLNYLQATKLAEVELILAMRALMLSMDLIRDTEKLKSIHLLTSAANDVNGIDNPDVDLDDLERELAVTEHYLGDDSSDRSRGLTLAFAKLWRMPTISTVKALRSTLKTEDILSLISLLRVELVRGAWTSLYIDPTSFDAEGNDPPPDGVIALISDLLSRCLDAIGSGGWLLNDALSFSDASEANDFLTALKLEVTAALEGIEEAVYLEGAVGEAARFGTLASKRGVGVSWNTNKPILMHVDSRESRMLPLGLKTKLAPSREKVTSSGEVYQRSKRETGHLISQQVAEYSLEKLAV